MKFPNCFHFIPQVDYYPYPKGLQLVEFITNITRDKNASLPFSNSSNSFIQMENLETASDTIVEFVPVSNPQLFQYVIEMLFYNFNFISDVSVQFSFSFSRNISIFENGFHPQTRPNGDIVSESYLNL